MAPRAARAFIRVEDQEVAFRPESPSLQVVRSRQAGLSCTYDHYLQHLNLLASVPP
jgi:hypothetical protein